MEIANRRRRQCRQALAIFLPSVVGLLVTLMSSAITVSGFIRFGSSNMEECVTTLVNDFGDVNEDVVYTVQNGTKTACHKKVRTEIRIRGNEHTEGGGQLANYIEVSKIIDGASSVELEHPMKIEASGSLDLEYGATYLQSVSSLPEEVVVKFGGFTNWGSCHADANRPSADNTCGFTAFPDGTPIPYSEGFCCDCSAAEFFGITKAEHRGSIDCGWTGGSSAHCAKFKGLKYSVFALGNKFLRSLIRVAVHRWDREAERYKMELLVVGSNNRIARTRDGEVVLRLAGVFNPEIDYDLSNYHLLLPQDQDHKQAQAVRGQNIGGIMLIEKEAFSLDGRSCGKIGAGFAAFVHDQGDRCRRKPQTCFDSGQPYHFWKKNVEMIEQGYPPVNFLSNFAETADVNSFHLSFGQSGTFWTLKFPLASDTLMSVALDINADNLIFKDYTSKMPGIIANAFGTRIKSRTIAGEMVALIRNIGLLNAEYSISVYNATVGLESIPAARTFSLAPKGEVDFKTDIYYGGDLSKAHLWLELKDALGVRVDTRQVHFNVSAFTEDFGNQDYRNPGVIKDGKDGGGSLGFLGDMIDTLTEFFGGWLYPLIGLVVALLLFCCCSKRIMRMCKCSGKGSDDHDSCCTFMCEGCGAAYQRIATCLAHLLCPDRARSRSHAAWDQVMEGRHMRVDNAAFEQALERRAVQQQDNPVRAASSWSDEPTDRAAGPTSSAFNIVINLGNGTGGEGVVTGIQGSSGGSGGGSGSSSGSTEINGSSSSSSSSSSSAKPIVTDGGPCPGYDGLSVEAGLANARNEIDTPKRDGGGSSSDAFTRIVSPPSTRRTLSLRPMEEILQNKLQSPGDSLNLFVKFSREHLPKPLTEDHHELVRLFGIDPGPQFSVKMRASRHQDPSKSNFICAFVSEVEVARAWNAAANTYYEPPRGTRLAKPRLLRIDCSFARVAQRSSNAYPGISFSLEDPTAQGYPCVNDGF